MTSFKLNSSAFYRTVDSIEKLKIRISLRQIANAKNPLLGENSEFYAFYQNSLGLLPPETLVFGWQEKTYGPSELLVFSESVEALDKGSTDLKALSRGYKSQIEKDKLGQPTLYTHLDTDGPLRVDEDEDVISPVSNQHPTPTPLAEQILRKRVIKSQQSQREIKTPRQKTVEGSTTAIRVPSLDPKLERQTVVQKPFDFLRNLEFPFTQMHVLASFPIMPSDDKENKENATEIKRVEKRLLTIRLYQSGLVSFTPDVTQNDQTYRFNIDDQIFEYTIENIVEPLTTADEDKEMKIYTEFYSRRAENALKSLRDFQFHKGLDPFSLYLFAFGEIVSATGFHGSHLYIKYQMDIPEGWRTQGRSNSMAGCTQAASPVYKTEKSEQSWQLSQPLEFELVSLGTDQPSKWPRLYLTVYSFDSWDRHTTEGYGYVEMPSHPGTYDVEVTTWRPFGDRVSRLRNFFIGGSPELEDVQFLNDLHSNKMKPKNRYGFHTETCGKIRLRWNLVHQAQQVFFKTLMRDRSLARPDPQSKDKDVSLSGNFMAISDALVRAKNRLRALKTRELNATE